MVTNSLLRVPDWLTPYDPVLGVTIEPEAPLVGDPVTVTAWSKERLGNVIARVLYPANDYEQELPHGSTSLGKEGGYRWWQWTTEPLPEAASYLIVIESDTHSTSDSFRAEEPCAPPEPPRGAPRVQYERTYVLMPPDARMGLLLKVVDAIFDLERWTTGGSADDGGLGDLDARTVIALSPEKYQNDLAAFYEEHYPGVEFWPLPYDNDYQLRGRLLAYSLKEAGVELFFPVTGEKRVTDEFGRWRGTYHHSGLDLAGRAHV